MSNIHVQGGASLIQLVNSAKEHGNPDSYNLRIPPIVLIMYTTRNREGAERERVDLETAMRKFNITPIIKCDLTRGEMLDSIREAQRVDNMSGLIVAVMSHGRKGSVETADVPLNINDILLQMNIQSLIGKPKALLVQACQVTRGHQPAGSMAREDAIDPRCVASATPPVDHFEIRHPDIMVLMASINGGLAYRNLMITMFSHNLSNSMAEEDLYDVFLKTHREILNSTPDQVAEFRSTLRRKLFLKQSQPSSINSILQQQPRFITTPGAKVTIEHTNKGKNLTISGNGAVYMM